MAGRRAHPPTTANRQSKIKNRKSSNALMAYDTTLNDIMTPPRGTPGEKASPSRGPRFRLKIKRPRTNRTTILVVVFVAAALAVVVASLR